MVEKKKAYYEPLKRDEIGTGMSPQESMEESKEIWETFEELAEDDSTDVSISKSDILDAIGEKGTYSKKQSELTVEDYLTDNVKRTDKDPVFHIGQRLVHPKYGYAFVTEANKIGKTNYISTRIGSDIVDFQGTDQELVDFFKKGQDIADGQGDVVVKKDKPDKAFTIVEEQPDGKTIKVRDNETGEETIVDKEFVEKKPLAGKYLKNSLYGEIRNPDYKKTAQVSNIAFDDFWELGAVPGQKSRLFTEYMSFARRSAPYMNVAQALDLSLDELKERHVYDVLSDMYEKWHAERTQEPEPVGTEEGMPLPVDTTLPLETPEMEPAPEGMMPGELELPTEGMPEDEELPIKEFPTEEAVLESKESTKKIAIVIGDVYQLGGHTLEVTNIYTLDDFGDVMLKVLYDGQQEVAIPYDSFIKEVQKAPQPAPQTPAQEPAEEPVGAPMPEMASKKKGRIDPEQMAGVIERYEGLKGPDDPECVSWGIGNDGKVRFKFSDGTFLNEDDMDNKIMSFGSKKKAQDDFPIEKTPDTELPALEPGPEGVGEGPDTVPVPEEEGETKGNTIWQDILKSILMEPDTAQKVVKKLIEMAEGQPELLTKIDSILPENGEWGNQQWLKKNSAKFYRDIISVFNKPKEQ